jgi:hypothetical protein
MMAFGGGRTMSITGLGAVLESLLGQSREQINVSALALVCGEQTVLQALALVDAREGPTKGTRLCHICAKLTVFLLVHVFSTPWGRILYTVCREPDCRIMELLTPGIDRFPVACSAPLSLVAGSAPAPLTPTIFSLLVPWRFASTYSPSASLRRSTGPHKFPRTASPLRSDTPAIPTVRKPHPTRLPDPVPSTGPILNSALVFCFAYALSRQIAQITRDN